MEKKKTSTDKINDALELIRLIKKQPNQDNYDSLMGLLGILFLAFLIYYFFIPAEPLTNQMPSTQEKISQENVLRGIVYSKDENKVYKQKVELYTTELNNIKNQVEALKEQRDNLQVDLDKRKELLLNEMKLKNEIKEIELSKANAEGWQEGYDKGLIDGRRQNEGSGFGAGMLMGHFLSK